MVFLHAVEENALHLQEKLTPAILSLHDSHSRWTAANKKRAWRSLTRPIKSTKWLMTSFLFNISWRIKKTQNTEVFHLIFHLKDRYFKRVIFITSGKWEKCYSVEMFFQLRLFSAVLFVTFTFEPLIPIPGKGSLISLSLSNTRIENTLTSDFWVMLMWK